jgi:foldase protein PrsA
MRTVTNILTALLICTTLACEPTTRQTTIEPSQPASEPTPQSAAASNEKARQDVMAQVNGEPIYMDILHDALVQDFGKPIAQHLVANKIVEQELVEQNLPTKVTDEQIRRQTQSTLQQLFNFDAEPTQQQLDNLRDQLLQQRGLTRRIWDATMHRNVQLERLAKAQVEVSQSELLREYHLQFGAKWRVQHIQVANLDTAREVRQKLQAGEDFEELAFKYSTNPDARRGALLPDISPRDEESPVERSIRQAALALNEPGELSHPVQAGTSFHILKLQEIIPPQATDFQTVRAQLEQAVRERKMAQLSQQLLQKLISESKIEYIDPTLREVMQRGDSND